MPRRSSHKWEFRARFRRHAYGWRSQPAITRIKEAVSEIKKVARGDPVLGAEGAVLFLERLSPAIERVDGSSGSIGAATHRAVEALVPVIAGAPADDATRDAWLDRLRTAHDDDGMAYLENIDEHWGALCASAETASRWADRLIEGCRLAWSADAGAGSWFSGTTACLSALLAVGRHQDLLDLLERKPNAIWSYRRFGVRALAAMGRPDEAIRYAEQVPRAHRSFDFAPLCEEILRAAGRVDEAYRRYGLLASDAPTHLARFRSLVKRYPHLEPARILDDLVERSPGEEGKWFATAKAAGFFDRAIDLANRSPCSPQTLTRAARDFGAERPEFAVAAGLAALRWLSTGHGYEVTEKDVDDAWSHTMRAAENAGCVAATRERVRALVDPAGHSAPLVTRALRRRLDLP
ncbi:MAG: hypothetical protein ACF8XB_04930 [Planctomycetota bacterium JB042]